MYIQMCILKCRSMHMQMYIHKPSQFNVLTLTKEQAISLSSLMYIQMDILECGYMRIQMYIHYRIKYETNLEVKAPSALSTLSE